MARDKLGSFRVMVDLPWLIPGGVNSCGPGDVCDGNSFLLKYPTNDLVV